MVVTLAVGVEQPAQDAQACTFRVLILAVSGFRAVSDDALDVPFIGIKQEAHKRLLVVRVATGVGFNNVTQAIVGQERSAASQRGAVESQRGRYEEHRWERAA